MVIKDILHHYIWDSRDLTRSQSLKWKMIAPTFKGKKIIDYVTFRQPIRLPRNWATMLLLSADFASNCQHFQGVCATRNQEMQRQRQQQQEQEEVPSGKFEGSPPPLLGALKLQSVAHHRHIARHISRTFRKSRQPVLSPASSAKVVVAKKNRTDTFHYTGYGWLIGILVMAVLQSLP